MKLIRYIFIFFFLALLYFPLINNKFTLIRKSYDGIIPLAPRFDIKRLDGYPKKFEDFFDNRLEIKPWMVTVNSNLKIRLLGVSPVPEKVIIGNDGWLFMGGSSIDEYKGTNLFGKPQLDIIKNKLHARAVNCREKYGAVLYFIIAPLKHTIYPEYLPGSVKKISKTTRFDQVLDCLKDDTLIHTVDFRKELMDQKSAHLLFYKTDNHWNDIGGRIAFQKIESGMMAQFPHYSPMDMSIFRLDSSQNLIGGEANMMNALNLYSEKRYDYFPTDKCKARTMPKRGYPPTNGFPYPDDYEIQMQTGDSSLPNAVIIRDSFTDAILPFLAERFNRSTFIFDGWEYGNNFAILEIEKPNVVMYIVLESHLNRLLEAD